MPTYLADDVCLGTNTQEGHLILLGDFFVVCQENHTERFIVISIL